MQDQSARQGVTHLTVEEAEAGQRIDNFLAKRMPGLPRSHIYRIIRTGQVRVNKGRIKPTRKLIAGDTIRIPPVRDAAGEQTTVPDAFVGAIESSIIYEDDRVIALNKPAGIAVHTGSGLSFGAIEALRQLRDNRRYELIHRLDRHTSGCLLIGKTLAATRLFQEHFRQRTVTKQYIALVAGRWHVHDLVISNRLANNVLISGERMVVEDSSGKSAVSRFDTVSKFSQASEMKIHIETGRTHQIRVHTSAAGYPIIGDTKYGDNSTNRFFKKMGLNRMYLHAEQLTIKDELQVSCGIGSDWESAKRALESQ